MGSLTMTSGAKRERIDLIVLALFFIVLLVIFSSLFSGVVWIELDTSQLGFWINWLIPLDIAIMAIVFTYSFVRYTQDQQFRHLVLILIAVNSILISIFYLLTNVAAIDWSPFASRERNRTITATFAFIVGPPLLLGSLTEETPVSKQQRNISLVYGGLITPTISTWFFLSPEPVFITSLPGGGVSGVTPVAWVIIIFTGLTMTAALVRSTRAWRERQDRIDMSIVMALMLWILSILLFSLQESPYQVMELVWLSAMTYGFLVISVAMIITAVVEPHKALVGLVEERTQEVEASRKESEFYLNLWGHKIGNILQGLVIYLDLLSLPDPRDPQNLQESARALSKEAKLINIQVGVLARVKEEKLLDLRSLNAQDAIQGAIKTMSALISPDTINVQFHNEIEQQWITADYLLESVFVNLLLFIARSTKMNVADVDINFKKTHDSVDVFVKYVGKPLSEDIETSVFHELHLFRTTLNLDLYSVKILMDHYDGSFEYHWLKESDQNQFVLRFKSTHQASIVDTSSQSENLDIAADGK